MFDNRAIREFYSLLRAAMMGAKKAGLLHRLVNDQTLPSILAKMPSNDWRQWARERPTWMREAIEEAFWSFIDQKWRDALNVAAAEPVGWGAGGGRGATHEADKGGSAEAKRRAQVAVHVVAADGKPQQQGDSGRRCIFADVLGCSGQHPPWNCKRFGNIRAKEREKIIEDNRLCAFCLLHDRAKACGAKEKRFNPACHAPGCKGKHIRKLHDLLKDMYKEENQVHLVQGDNEWEESEGAWEIDEEEEAVIVGTIQQEEDSSWQEVSDLWMELEEGEVGGAFCVGTCQGVSNQAPEVGVGCSSEAQRPPEDEEDEGIIEGGWWSSDQGELQVSEEEREYFIELLMGGSAAGGCKAALERPSAAAGTTGQPARKEGAVEAQPQGETRGTRKPTTGKEKERSKEGASKGENELGTRTRGKETGDRGKEEPGEWWPSGRKWEGPPGPYPGPEAKDESVTRPDPAESSEVRAQATTTSRGECSGP
jgi:hypothetical protein